MADLVVAKDGSGNFTTVTDAINAAPNNSDTRFVIYVKAGGYYENVEVGKSKTNIMLIGDGMWKTAIKGNRNVVDGWTTFRSATVGQCFYLSLASFYVCVCVRFTLYSFCLNLFITCLFFSFRNPCMIINFFKCI